MLGVEWAIDRWTAPKMYLGSPGASHPINRDNTDLQMMKKLKLNEGDPVRLNGTALPKGKLVKIQAQSTDFLEVSDAKAVYAFFSLF